MRLAVVGASGRMGRAVVRLASSQGISVVCAVGTTDVGRDAGDLAGIGPIGVCVVDGIGAIGQTEADVVIDFSTPAATAAMAPLAASRRVAIVSGTTGLAAEAREALSRAARDVPVLAEPNMSVGVAVLSTLVKMAATMCAGFDLEIVEVHHRAKVDAPSGTALRLAEIAAEARGGGSQVHGRQGRPGPRRDDEVGMHAVRGGDVIGDHTVHLMGGGERLELTHRATSRDVFAYGALRAAAFVAGKDPGTYTLRDVLGDATMARSSA
jgi:4-hydroxy-tetrahydrodipicolinate reductase